MVLQQHFSIHFKCHQKIVGIKFAMESKGVRNHKIFIYFLILFMHNNQNRKSHSDPHFCQAIGWHLKTVSIQLDAIEEPLIKLTRSHYRLQCADWLTELRLFHSSGSEKAVIWIPEFRYFRDKVAEHENISIKFKLKWYLRIRFHICAEFQENVSVRRADFLMLELSLNRIFCQTKKNTRTNTFWHIMSLGEIINWVQNSSVNFHANSVGMVCIFENRKTMWHLKVIISECFSVDHTHRNDARNKQMKNQIAITGNA